MIQIIENKNWLFIKLSGSDGPGLINSILSMVALFIISVGNGGIKGIFQFLIRINCLKAWRVQKDFIIRMATINNSFFPIYWIR